MTPRVIFALCFTLLSWASAFSAIRMCLVPPAPGEPPPFSPGALTLYRLSAAAITLLIASLALRVLKPPDRADVPRIAFCGFLGAGLYHTLLNFGQVTVEAGPASFLVNTAPLFTALFARIFLNDRLSLLGYLGMAVSFSGVVLIILGRGKTIEFDARALIILSAAVSYSSFIVLQKPLLSRYHPVTFTFYVLAAGAMWTSVFIPDLVRDFPTADAHHHGLAIYLGAVPAGLGYLGWTYVQSNLPASRAVSFFYLTPVIATTIAWFWLGEVLTALTMIGGCVVLAGVVVVNRFGKRIHTQVKS